MSDNHTTPIPTNDRDGRIALADRVRSLKLPAGANGRRRGLFFWLPWVLLIGLAGVILFQRFGGGMFKPAASDDAKLKVQTQEETLAADGVALEAGGYVVPVEIVQVTPKVGGRVLKSYIAVEGQYFNKGDVLAELETDEFKFDLDRAAALLGEAKAQALQMSAKYEESKSGLLEIKLAMAMLGETEEVVKQLKAEEERLVKAGTSTSVDDLEKVRSRRLQAEFKVKQLVEQHKMMETGRPERVAAAKAESEMAGKRIIQAQADYDRAKYRYDNCKIISPVGGVILRKQVVEGSTVQPAATSSSLSPSMCEMADLRRLEIELDVSERDLKRVYAGQKCYIYTEAYPDVRYVGYVNRMMPVAIRSKASVQIKVTVLLPDYGWFQALPMLTGMAMAELPSALVGVQSLSAWSQGRMFTPDPFLRPDLRARVRFMAPEKPKPANESNASASTP